MRDEERGVQAEEDERVLARDVVVVHVEDDETREQAREEEAVRDEERRGQMDVENVAGLARVEKTASKRSLPLLQALQEKERGAKAERNGMWTYGDIDDDDD